MEDQRREKDNPFQPISLDERLSRPVPKTRHTVHEPMMMRPASCTAARRFISPPSWVLPPRLNRRLRRRSPFLRSSRSVR